MIRNYSRKIQNIYPASNKASWLISANLFLSFRYAMQGLVFGFRTQRNFRIHILLAAIAFVLALFLKITISNIAILILTVTAVLVLELLNTSIEALVDLSIGRRFHPLAKVAKDCAAASVLVASIASLVIGGLLILPPLLTYMGF